MFSLRLQTAFKSFKTPISAERGDSKRLLSSHTTPSTHSFVAIYPGRRAEKNLSQKFWVRRNHLWIYKPTTETTFRSPWKNLESAGIHHGLRMIYIYIYHCQHCKLRKSENPFNYEPLTISDPSWCPVPSTSRKSPRPRDKSWIPMDLPWYPPWWMWTWKKCGRNSTVIISHQHFWCRTEPPSAPSAPFRIFGLPWFHRHPPDLDPHCGSWRYRVTDTLKIHENSWLPSGSLWDPENDQFIVETHLSSPIYQGHPGSLLIY